MLCDADVAIHRSRRTTTDRTKRILKRGTFWKIYVCGRNVSVIFFSFFTRFVGMMKKNNKQLKLCFFTGYPVEFISKIYHVIVISHSIRVCFTRRFIIVRRVRVFEAFQPSTRDHRKQIKRIFLTDVCPKRVFKILLNFRTCSRRLSGRGR